MLSLFRKNSFFNSILLLVYAIILQIIPAIMNPATTPDVDASLWFRSLSPVFLILLLFVQAIFLNRMVIENRLHRDIMLFPGVFFILYASLLPEFWQFNHIHVANLFVIWGVNELFYIYKTSNPAVHIFNASLLIGIASILCPPMIWYLLLIIIGISNLKKMELVHPLQILIGASTAWFLWLTFSFWRGQELTLWPSFSSHLGFNLMQLISDKQDAVHYVCFLLLLVFIFLLYNEFRKKKHIQAQKKIDILLFTLFFNLIVILFHNPASLDMLLIASPMIGIFLGLFFSHFKNMMIPELIHLVLFIGVLMMQLFSYFNFN